MKKFKFFALVAAVMVITLLSVSGAWAGPAQQGTEVPPGSFTGAAGQTAIDVSTLPPAPAGLTTFAAVSQVGPGTVCFTIPWGLIVQNPTIRVLDNGIWTASGITTTLTGIAPDGSGLQYCAHVGTGTFGLQGF